MGTQIKNFFKIDQEIVYMIQHPRKAKTRNVLKLLGAIIVFLLLLCGILHVLGSSYQCTDLVEKIKQLAKQVSEHTIGPMEALRRVREWLAGAWKSIKGSAPVATALTAISPKLLTAGEHLFEEPVEAPIGSKPSKPLALHEKVHAMRVETFKQLREKIEKHEGFGAKKAYVLRLVDDVQRNNYLSDETPIGIMLDDNVVLSKYINLA